MTPLLRQCLLFQIHKEAFCWGSGTLRIAEVLKEAGLPKPLFVSESNRFKLILNQERVGKHEPKEHSLSERQHKAVAYLKKHEYINNSDYQRITGVSKRTATRELSDLVAKNVLTSSKVTRGRGSVYYLNS